MGVGGGVENYFGVLLMAKPEFWVLALAQVEQFQFLQNCI